MKTTKWGARCDKILSAIGEHPSRQSYYDCDMDINIFELMEWNFKNKIFDDHDFKRAMKFYNSGCEFHWQPRDCDCPDPAPGSNRLRTDDGAIILHICSNGASKKTRKILGELFATFRSATIKDGMKSSLDNKKIMKQTKE